MGRLDVEVKEVNKSVGRVEAKVEGFSRGFGHGLELYNKEWLAKYLNIQSSLIRNRHNFSDPLGRVHKNQEYVELDLFCLDPLIVAEVILCDVCTKIRNM